MLLFLVGTRATDVGTALPNCMENADLKSLELLDIQPAAAK
jgi:hypothetical protein